MAKVNLEAALRITDDIERAKRKRGEVEETISLGRDEIRSQILAQYDSLSEPRPNDADLNYAVDRFLSKQRRFEPASPSLTTAVAKAWIHRTAIGIGAAAVAGVLAAGMATNAFLTYAKKQSLLADEARVEERVESLYDNYVRLGSNIGTIAGDAMVEELSQSQISSFNTSLDEARASINLAGEFFNGLIVDGEADSAITLENFRSVEQNADFAETSIAGAENEVNVAVSILNGRREQIRLAEQRAQALVDIRQTLQASYTDIQSADAPNVLDRRAGQTYNLGLAAVQSEDLETARQYAHQLSEIKGNVAKFRTLMGQPDVLYRSINQIINPAEREGRRQVDEMYGLARTSIESVDITNLESAVLSLQNLDASLKTECTLLPHPQFTPDSRYERKNGVKRRWKEDGRWSGSEILYVFTGCQDSNGNWVEMNVENDECKAGGCSGGPARENVEAWGIWMPDDTVFNVFLPDRQSGRAVSIGEKERGFLEPEYNDRYIETDQEIRTITRWMN